MASSEVQKGAYKAGRPATHTGKILYPQCKKGVWPPSDWDPALAARSASLPDIKLQLEFVYGYDGWVRAWGCGGAQWHMPLLLNWACVWGEVWGTLATTA